MFEVTGLWLLMEFAAQGVGLDDLSAALRGDEQGLLASKMALGMLLPMRHGHPFHIDHIGYLI